MPPHSSIDHSDDSSTMKDDLETQTPSQPLQMLEIELEPQQHFYDNHNSYNNCHDDPCNDSMNDNNMIGYNIQDEKEFEDIVLEDYDVWNNQTDGNDDDINVPQIKPTRIDYLSNAEERNHKSSPEAAMVTTEIFEETNKSLSIGVPKKFAFALPVKKRRNIRKKKSVTFDAIRVREYTQVLGDHPCCTIGPPISLGWEYIQNGVKSLDEYEATRRRRRNRRELRLSWEVRRAKLSEFDSHATNGELRAVQRKIFRDRCNAVGNNDTKAFFMTTTTLEQPLASTTPVAE